MEPQKSPKKQLHKAIELSSAGLQMGLIIYLGALFGEWLDATFLTTYLKETITLVSIFLSIFIFIRKASKLND